MWILLAAMVCMSAAYLTMNTGQMAAQRVKPDTITPVNELAAGKVIDVPITLITADAYGLSCASDMKVGNNHCAFGADTKPWPRKDDEPAAKPEHIIAPYMTADNVLILVPGLFTQPVLKKRLDDEPPGKFSREELENRRFTVTCKFKAEQKMEKFKVRWANNQSWSDKDAAWVGTVSDCKMTGG